MLRWLFGSGGKDEPRPREPSVWEVSHRRLIGDLIYDTGTAEQVTDGEVSRLFRTANGRFFHVWFRTDWECFAPTGEAQVEALTHEQAVKYVSDRLPADEAAKVLAKHFDVTVREA